MSDRRRSPAVRALVGTLGTSVLLQGLLFISGVVAARLLGPSDRGHLALIWTISLTIVQVGSLGLPLAVTLELSTGRTTVGALLRTIARPVARQIVLVTLVQAFAIAVLVEVSTVPPAAAWASLVVVPLTLVQMLSDAAVQGTQRFTAMNVIRISPLIVYAVALGVLASLGAVTLLSTTLVWAAGYGVGAVCGVVAIRRRPERAEPDSTPPPDLPAMRRFGLRGFLGWVSPTDTLRIDQLVVGLVLPARTLGIYVAALAFTNLPRFVAQGVGLVAFPAVAGAPPGPARRRAMVVYTLFGAGISVVACGFIALLAGPLVRIAFGDEFRSAAGPLRVLLAATALLCVRRIVSDVLRGAGQEQRGSQAEAVSWIVLVPGLVLLAGPYGLYGVSITLFITYALSLLAIVVLARRRGFDGGDTPADPDPVPPPDLQDPLPATPGTMPAGSPPAAG